MAEGPVAESNPEFSGGPDGVADQGRLQRPIGMGDPGQGMPQYPGSGMPQYAGQGMPQYPEPGMLQYPGPGMPQYLGSGMPQYSRQGMTQYASQGMPPGMAKGLNQYYSGPGVPQYSVQGMPQSPMNGMPYLGQRMANYASARQQYQRQQYAEARQQNLGSSLRNPAQGNPSNLNYRRNAVQAMQQEIQGSAPFQPLSYLPNKVQKAKIETKPLQNHSELLSNATYQDKEDDEKNFLQDVRNQYLLYKLKGECKQIKTLFEKLPGTPITLD